MAIYELRGLPSLRINCHTWAQSSIDLSFKHNISPIVIGPNRISRTNPSCSGIIGIEFQDRLRHYFPKPRYVIELRMRSKAILIIRAQMCRHEHDGSCRHFHLSCRPFSGMLPAC